MTRTAKQIQRHGRPGRPGLYSSINNFDNEVEILQSRTLIKKVVEELDLYINYATRAVSMTSNFTKVPHESMDYPEEAQKLPAPYLHLTFAAGQQAECETRIGEEEYNKQFDKLPALLTTPSGTFSFTPKDSTTVQSTQKSWLRFLPRSVANAYRGALSIEPTSKSTTIAQISVKEHAYAARHGFHQQAGGSLQPGCQR